LWAFLFYIVQYLYGTINFKTKTLLNQTIGHRFRKIVLLLKKEIEILYDFIHIYSSQKSYSAAKEDYQCFLLI